MPRPEPNPFFQKTRSYAEVKLELIGKCFEDWACRQLGLYPPDEKASFHFIDLNAATGYTADATHSMATAFWRKLLLCAAKTQRLQQAVRFYACSPAKADLMELRDQLAHFPVYDTFPESFLLLSDPENKLLLVETLAAGAPSFIYLDPFLHSGAQEIMLNALQLPRNPDILLQFEPNGMRKALSGKKVSQALDALFGDRLPLIRAYFRKEKDHVRHQDYIVQQLNSLLREQGFYTLLFRINHPDSGAASHYLLFITKQANNYTGFKKIILPYSDYQHDGVPLLLANQSQEAQLSLFPNKPKYSVALLQEELAGGGPAYKFRSVEKVFELHSTNTPYTRENYLAAFEQLRDAGKVELLNGKTLQTVRKATLTSVVKYLQ